MSFDLSGLGNLIRVFRESRSLSQQALASKIHPPTNRSVIAHLEQGLRVPPTGVLQALCEYLEIPRPLWERFVLRADTFRAGSLPQGTTTAPKYIAVAGMIGSGKTTLARAIANALGYRYLPEDVSAKNYLADLVSDPGRWAFETQLAFLITKSLSLQDALAKNIPVILDRSLSEDIGVFAEYFRSKTDITERSFTTYQALAQYFVSSLPLPDLIIFCQIDLETAKARVSSRKRSDRSLHSDDYLSSIHGLYERWLRAYSASTLCVVHSDEHDWREERTVQTLVRELDTLWSTRNSSLVQLDLFESGLAGQPKPSDTEVLHLVVDRRPVVEVHSPVAEVHSPVPRAVLPFPSVYIAAPFTAAEEPSPSSVPQTLFGPAHGRIPRRRYRRALENLDGALRTLGLHTTLPHRDINSWGSVQLTPQQVAASCSEQVAASDVFVGLPAMSHGTHYEFGIARGLNKPAVIIDCAEMPSSFIASGFRTDDRLLVVQAKTLASLASRITQDDVVSFLSQYIPLTKSSS